MTFLSIQQNLNQIAQICNQLSQNERNATQQLMHCVQLVNQVSQQMQQFARSTTAGQFTGVTPGVSPGVTPGVGYTPTNWSNIPLNVSQYGPTGYTGATGQFASTAKFDPAIGSQATGQAVFNTNKDLNQ